MSLFEVKKRNDCQLSRLHTLRLRALRIGAELLTV